MSGAQGFVGAGREQQREQRVDQHPGGDVARLGAVGPIGRVPIEGVEQRVVETSTERCTEVRQTRGHTVDVDARLAVTEHELVGQ